MGSPMFDGQIKLRFRNRCWELAVYSNDGRETRAGRREISPIEALKIAKLASSELAEEVKRVIREQAEFERYWLRELESSKDDRIKLILNDIARAEIRHAEAVRVMHEAERLAPDEAS